MKSISPILLVLFVLGVLPASFAQPGKMKPKLSVGEKTFTVYDAPSNCETLLSVPFYFAPGETRDLKSAKTKPKFSCDATKAI